MARRWRGGPAAGRPPARRPRRPRGAAGGCPAHPPRGPPSAPSASAAMAPGSIVVDMSTSSLEVGRRARAEAGAAGVDFLDAPVAGQTIGAEAGTLAIYAGGEPEAFARALPVLEAMGDPQGIFLLGPGGCGYAVKLLLNLTWFIQAVATAEALSI